MLVIVERREPRSQSRAHQGALVPGTIMFVAVHESGFGTSRHFAAVPNSRRDRSEADMLRVGSFYKRCCKRRFQPRCVASCDKA
jgi:hypothetical protein